MRRAEPALSSIPTSAESGWLTAAQVADVIAATFGTRVAVRTVQSWTRHKRRPLPAVRLGTRLLIHHGDLLNWLRGAPTTATGEGL